MSWRLDRPRGRILLVLLAPSISPYKPTEQFRRHRLQSPNAEFLLGTDNLGRDIFTRILYGGQVSLQVGIVSVAIGATLGILLGLVAGYLGGWAGCAHHALHRHDAGFPRASCWRWSSLPCSGATCRM